MVDKVKNDNCGTFNDGHYSARFRKSVGHKFILELLRYSPVAVRSFLKLFLAVTQVKAPTKHAMKTSKLALEAYARTHVPARIHSMFFQETQSVNCQKRRMCHTNLLAAAR
jgi:hypothetical protein